MRPFTGSRATSFPVTVPPTLASCVCSTVAVACTSTFSLTTPTSSLKSTLTLAAASRTTFCCTCVLKPGADSGYFIRSRVERKDAVGPGLVGRQFASNARRGVLDCDVGAGDPSPAGSVTSPTMVALVVCANAVLASARTAQTQPRGES